ncbi:hypothetical protein OIU74_007406 [Salix koriyanagi]|uniref:Uncharacterized protein n=1 Tax=Salix koriyanagi TaxID=2511006 RepID=A0A9Q0U3R0_9ROSI|nr:hypothetical protein OIU74_007406 [Salix koriyanagi]
MRRHVLYCFGFLPRLENIVARRIFLRGKKPKDEVQIYTWKNATLRQSTDLQMRSQGCKASNVFALGFPVRKGWKSGQGDKSIRIVANI